MESADLRQAANEWISEFALSLKNVSLYSAEHPRGKDSIGRSYEKLKRVLKGRLDVTLARAEGRLTLENVPVDRDRTVSSQLHRDLEDRGVQSIVFNAAVTEDEYSGLLRALLLKPEKIQERGGLDLILIDQGISAIAANKARIGKPPEAVELLSEQTLMDLLAGRLSNIGGDSLSAILAADPAGVARALQEAASKRDPSTKGPDAEFRADHVADSMERLAERALEERERDRGSILADLSRVLAAEEPDLQGRILSEKAGPRSPRRNLSAAVESMPPEALADVITAQFTRKDGDYESIYALLERSVAWKHDREAALAALQARMQDRGSTEQEYGDLIDHLMWAELDVGRRVRLLNQRDYLWSVDFQRVKEVLVKLFATEQIKDATSLIQKYLGGLLLEDAMVRRKVAENARYVLHLLEKTGKGLPMLGRIVEIFMARIHDEADPEVRSRIAAALAFLADLRLRNGEMPAVLDLMRRAETLAATADRTVAERGEGLCQALARVGNEKLFKEMTDRYLAGTDSTATESAEILKRAGARAANYLIDRLADEEDRGNRARLVSLLKDMNRSSYVPFTARLKDPRWFLVRNVVHILGELGDAAALPALKEIARHEDPRVRKELVRTYTRFGTQECEDLIVEAVLDVDRAVQVAAVNALSILRGRRSAGVVLEVIRRAGPYASVDAEVREEAVAAAGRMELRESVELLVEIVTRKGFLGFAESTTIRQQAVQALGLIGGDAAIGTLKEVAKSEGKREVRDAARAAMISLGAAPE